MPNEPEPHLVIKLDCSLDKGQARKTLLL